MNEQEIKEKLLEESKGYEIKTKSEDIIEAFKMKKYKKFLESIYYFCFFFGPFYSYSCSYLFGDS